MTPDAPRRIAYRYLKRLAEKLEAGNAHGPWEWQGGYPQRITNGAAVLLAEVYENPDVISQIAEYIAAASPDVVLALLSELATTRQRLDAIEKLLGNLNLDKFPPEVAIAVNAAYAQSRHDWPEYVSLVDGAA